MNAEPHAADLRPEAEGPRRRGPIKFAYASGARPLDGYTIKRGIGAGGFGDVYYATSDAGKEVALKRIQRNLDVELRGVRQCLNLKHPNLLSLYDIRYDDDQQAWVVMEYVGGESLQEVIERHPQGMPEDEVVRWFAGITAGVEYLHDHGIVHRDLKPGNIFFDQSVVKIGDYGLSKFISCSRRSGQTESVGTFHYMAPEIGLGRYGKEIDIYALGILLYEMLTGHVPFEGESSQEIIMKHLTSQPDLSAVPPGYRALIARALAKDPADRYQSVEEMWRELTALQGSRTAEDRAWTPPPRSASAKSARCGGSGAWQRMLYNARGWARRHQVEPIAAGLRTRYDATRQWWHSLTPRGRTVTGVVTVIAILANSAWLFPLLFALAAVYGVYYLVWSCLNLPASNSPTLRPFKDSIPDPLKATVAAPQFASPRPVMATVEPAAPSVRRGGPTRQQLNEALREALTRKTFAQRASELTGSMLMAALVTAVIGLVMTVATSPQLDRAVRSWGPPYAWLVLTSVTASWTILFFGKLWEGSSGDHALRRFCLMVAGMGVGTLASVLAQSLAVDPVYLVGSWQDFRHSAGATLPALYSVTGEPQTMAYAGYFGGLFLTLRWWLGADPLRAARFSLFGTLVTVVAAMLWYGILPIPRGFLVAATTAVAVQLSAPWVPPRQRNKFKERLAA
jgi:hypothetical protein